jgi:hypothetical protein
MTSSRYASTLAVIALVALGACQKKEPEPAAPVKPVADAAKAPVAAAPAEPPPAAASQPNPERNAYFGETHIHTSWSVDAWVMGNRITGPAEAYKYAKGETIKHPMGFDIKIDTPARLHGRDRPLGVCRRHQAGQHPGVLREHAAGSAADDHEGPEQQGRTEPGLLVPAQACRERAGEGVDGPEDHVHRMEGERPDRRRGEQPGKFTAFCSYEWTSMPDNRNLHRNVFFRDCAKVPDYPFSALDSTNPTELWNWMDAQRKAATSCSRSRTTPTSATAAMYPTDVDPPPGGRSTPPGPSRACATSAWSRSSRARDSRRRIRCCRPTTSSPTTSCTRPSSACRPTSAASTASPAATRARR